MMSASQRSVNRLKHQNGCSSPHSWASSGCLCRLAPSLQMLEHPPAIHRCDIISYYNMLPLSERVLSMSGMGVARIFQKGEGGGGVGVRGGHTK